MFSSPIVSAQWLRKHLSEVCVVDVRWYLDGRSGRDAFERGHVPTAVFADLDVDLAAAPSRDTGRHPLPEAEDFAATMGALGVGDNVAVVAYDDAGGAMAARLWWMLHVLDHPVAVLDGGVSSWSGPFEVGPVSAEPVTFTTKAWPTDRFVDADDVARGAFDVLIDARTSDRYSGQNDAVDPRPGHIPGAVNAPFPDNLADGRFRPSDELRHRFGQFGIEATTNVVAYCGSGVTACHDLLALELCGLGANTSLFVGSASAWAGDPTRPLALGAEPNGHARR